MPFTENRGWQVTDDGVRNVWYLCTQLPASLSRTSSKVHSKPAVHDDAEDEVPGKEQEAKSRSLPRKRQKQEVDRTVSVESDTVDEATKYY